MNIPMRILRALGLGLFLVIIMLLLPAVFYELSKTIVVFLQSSQEVFSAAAVMASYAGL
jgi:ABC-type transport system involved in cytochrome bd biosynthesis fused ATPase/permease subunit